ncbi:MAG: helix-turn-helix domain-containing protein [Clostridia bacterium]|nr:helix-turn-helix domain-containing protein [Clostridia bacterium]
MKYTDKIFFFDNVYSKGHLKLPIGSLYQVSELSMIRNSEISMHIQECDEITYVISGSARVYSNDQTSIIKTGQIHFIKQGNKHKIEVLPGENFRFLCIGIIPDRNCDVINEFYEKIKYNTHFIINDNDTVKFLSEFLIREFYNKDEYSHGIINQYIYLFFAAMLRVLSNKNFDYRTKAKEKSSNHAMYRLLRYIDREYLHIENIKSISEAVSYSEYYILHLFKEKMGITIKEYVTKKKIIYSTELLRTSNLTVEQIATQLGFSCAYSFRRTFKKYINATPNEYRNNSDSSFCSPKQQLNIL